MPLPFSLLGVLPSQVEALVLFELPDLFEKLWNHPHFRLVNKQAPTLPLLGPNREIRLRKYYLQIWCLFHCCLIHDVALSGIAEGWLLLSHVLDNQLLVRQRCGHFLQETGCWHFCCLQPLLQYTCKIHCVGNCCVYQNAHLPNWFIMVVIR